MVKSGSSILEKLVVSGGCDGDIAGSQVPASLNSAITDVSKDAVPTSLLKVVGENEATSNFVTVTAERGGGE